MNPYTLNYITKYGKNPEITIADNSNAIGYVDIPETIRGYSVTEIDDSAFKYAYSLTGVTIPDSVVTIGNLAFYDCVKLSTVTIGRGVTSIGNHAFHFCTKLTSIAIPASVITIGIEAFPETAIITRY